MKITVHRNGDVTVSSSGEEDRVLDRGDPTAIIGCFRAGVELEDGIIASEVMQALKPWSGVLSMAAGCDFNDWAEAMAGPGSAQPEDGDEQISRLELVPSITYYGKGEQREMTVNWEFLGRYAAPQVGPTGNIHDVCAVSFCDPKLLGGLPLKILDHASIKDFGQKYPDGHVTTVRVPQDFFSTIVLGFIDELTFYGSPEETAEHGREIRQSVEEIQASLHEASSRD